MRHTKNKAGGAEISLSLAVGYYWFDCAYGHSKA